MEKKALKQNLNKTAFSPLVNLLEHALFEGFPSTQLLVSTEGFMEAECVHMDPVERRGSQGLPQVTGRHCRRM